VTWAQELYGLNLCVLEPRDPLANGALDAVVYDLDSLPASLRKNVLAELLAGPAAAPAGVHSYNSTRSRSTGWPPTACLCGAAWTRTC
jgi:hypothetical protein